jgi:inosine-uridine nucleoside N-ribohydrolase
MVGLDVTRKALLREEHIRTLEAANHSMSRAAGQITRATMNRIRKSSSTGGPVMHDSLAVATFLDPGIVTFRDYYIEVETAGELTAGETLGYERAPLRRSAPMANGPAAQQDRTTFQRNAKVAVDVDVERFFAMLVGRLSGQHATA